MTAAAVAVAAQTAPDALISSGAPSREIESYTNARTAANLGRLEVCPACADSCATSFDHTNPRQINKEIVFSGDL